MTKLGRSLLLVLIVLGLGCADSNYGKDDNNDAPAPSENNGGSPNPTPSATLTGDYYYTSCGVVVDGALASPVYASQGERVTIVQAVSPNFVIIRRGAGDQLVELQGIVPAAGYEAAATAQLAKHQGESALFFQAGTSCTATTPQGAVGVVGSLLTTSGSSYAEELLEGGVVDADRIPSCGSGLVSSCLAGLKGEAPSTTAGEVTDFLWKPSAESSYNPGGLIIHVSPCNIRVVVNGETLPDYGPGNGRCITARSQKPGCSYGRNVHVDLLDIDTGLPYTHAGQSFVTVPNGCSRFEFKQ